MKLKRIVLSGFKSFANRTIIKISDGITAVVGPNGSGKSNILDAVRWLFGEHSLKTLRADEKFDVLFAGSERTPPARRAYVEMVFEEDGEEISIAKELTRDGKMRYYVNNTVARLKDIKELFKGTGAGRDFYSIIAQGQVEKIVTSSGKELRQLFEEAAGIAYYREKKKETLQKLDTVRQNLSRLNDVIYEMEKRMNSLYLRAKRAQRYLEYTERLEEIKRVYYGNLLERAREKLSHLEEEFAGSKEKLREIQRTLADTESQLTSLRSEMEEMDEKLGRFTKMLENYEKRKQQLLDLKNAYSRRLSDLENRLVESSTRIDALKEERKRLIARREEVDMIRKTLEEELEVKLRKLAELEDKRSEMMRNLSEKERELMELREEFEEIEKRLIRLDSEILRLTESVEDSEKKILLIESQIDQKSRRLKGLEREIEEMSARLSEFSEKEREILNEIDKIRTRRKEISSDKDRISSEMNDLTRKRSELESEILVLRKNLEEYAGFSRTVREIFENRSLFSGLYDVVANLIEVDEEHERAIEALIGGGLQNVVVRDADVAKEIIEFLKVRDLGRATFLPLDLIEGKRIRIKGIEKHPGFIGYAADLVRIPEGFEAVIGYLLGRDIVVRDIDDAVDIKRKYRVNGRIATLDGDVVGSRGAITGGSSRRRDPILGRKNRLKKLELEKDFVERRMKDLERELKKLDDELKEIRSYEESLEMDLRELSSKGSSMKRVLEEVIKTSTELREEIESLRGLKNDYSVKLAGMKERIKRLEEDREELKRRAEELRISVEESTGELEMWRKEIKEISEEMSGLSLEVRSLKEKKERYDSERESVSRRLEEIDETVENLEIEISELEERIKSVKKMMEESEIELNTLKRESEELFASMKLHHSDKEEKLRRMRELEEEIEKLKEERENIREYMHHLDMEKQMTTLKVQNYLSEIGEVDEVEKLSDEELSELESEISELESKVKHIGPVDLSVIDEYEEVEKEYSKLLERRKDLEDAREKLMDIMKRTEEEAKEKFMEVFEKVNENFSRFISTLFFGGEGKIKMVSEGDVFDSELEISVKKPGRRMQKLQLLSGGEKALVAIALLFSFLKVNPSPFYILDEVDAPLDDYNAERFKELLKESSKEAQFVIITHNKIVMEAADVLNGIAMTDGVSVVVPVEMLIETV